MKTKIIPFDLETAKKIQAGEIEGKIKTRDLKTTMNIVCYNSTAKYSGYIQPIIAQATDDCCDIRAYFEDGLFIDSEKNDEDLVLEVPDIKAQFKPFDKVLVRGGRSTVAQERNILVPAYYQYHDLPRFEGDDETYFASGLYWRECIPYEGNQHLVGTTDKPKEE